MFTDFSRLALPDAPFFDLLHQARLSDHPAVILTEIRFTLTHFDERLFEQCQIRAPKNLANAVKKRRAEYLASRYAARQAMASLGIVDFLLANDASRAPVWPPAVIGSLSHSHQRAVVLATTSPLLSGIDVENVMDGKTAESLHEAIISHEELQLLARLDLPFATALSLVFSLKESLYKAIYPQLKQFMDFHSAAVTMVDINTGRALLRLTQTAAAAFPAGREFAGRFQLQQHEILSFVVSETDS